MIYGKMSLGAWGWAVGVFIAVWMIVWAVVNLLNPTAFKGDPAPELGDLSEPFDQWTLGAVTVDSPLTVEFVWPVECRSVELGKIRCEVADAGSDETAVSGQR